MGLEQSIGGRQTHGDKLTLQDTECKDLELNRRTQTMFTSWKRQIQTCYKAGTSFESKWNCGWNSSIGLDWTVPLRANGTV